jgi:hypothetical protein
MRIGEGRTVAEEFRHDMQAVSQPRHLGERLRLFRSQVRQQHRQGEAALLRQRRRRAGSRMGRTEADRSRHPPQTGRPSFSQRPGTMAE